MYQDLSDSISETVGNKGTHISQCKEKENQKFVVIEATKAKFDTTSPIK